MEKKRYKNSQISDLKNSTKLENPGREAYLGKATASILNMFRLRHPGGIQGKLLRQLLNVVSDKRKSGRSGNLGNLWHIGGF